MGCFSHWAKKFDKFDIPISLRHNGEDSYSTWVGGFLTLVIVGFAIIFAIIDFIPFVKRKNYSLYYYTINLNETEEINLMRSKSSLSFGFECSNKQNPEKYINNKIEDLLELKVRYIFYTNHGENKNTSVINIHYCNSSDFYNDRNILYSLDKNKLNNLMCLNDLNKVIKNRYQDKHDNFTYYDIDIIAKNNSNISSIRDYLLDNDCKIELYYIDVKIEVDDYRNPIKPFLNEVFLQLDPDFHVRMNTFFMNEYFENNDDLFFPSKSSPKINNLFSRTEQYFLHRGANTGEDSFARIYIRADTRKMEIRRRYQTVLEFFADTFSFWDYLFLLVNFFIKGYDKVCLNYSIGEKIFLVKDNKTKKINLSDNSQKKKSYCDSVSGTNITNRAFSNAKILNKRTSDNMILQNQKDNKDNNEKTNKEGKKCKCKWLDKFCISMKECWDYFLNKLNLCEYCNKNYKESKYGINCFTCTKCRTKYPYFYEEEFINEKLEVVYYLKCILLLEIFRDEINSDKKEILNFLSMPIIPLNKDEKKEEEIKEEKIKKEKYYKNINSYSSTDFEILNERISFFKKKLILKNDEQKYVELAEKKWNI